MSSFLQRMAQAVLQPSQAIRPVASAAMAKPRDAAPWLRGDPEEPGARSLPIDSDLKVPPDRALDPLLNEATADTEPLFRLPLAREVAAEEPAARADRGLALDEGIAEKKEIAAAPAGSSISAQLPATGATLPAPLPAGRARPSSAAIAGPPAPRSAVDTGTPPASAAPATRAPRIEPSLVSSLRVEPRREAGEADPAPAPIAHSPPESSDAGAAPTVLTSPPAMASPLARLRQPAGPRRNETAMPPNHARVHDEIEIHIGRIEVTAVPPPPLRAPARPQRKGVSLDEYLRRRDGRLS